MKLDGKSGFCALYSVKYTVAKGKIVSLFLTSFSLSFLIS